MSIDRPELSDITHADQELIELSYKVAEGVFCDLKKAINTQKPHLFFAYFMLEDPQHELTNAVFLDLCAKEASFFAESAYELLLEQQHRSDDDPHPFAVKYSVSPFDWSQADQA